jgi:hypothetical protein
MFHLFMHNTQHDSCLNSRNTTWSRSASKYQVVLNFLLPLINFYWSTKDCYKYNKKNEKERNKETKLNQIKKSGKTLLAAKSYLQYSYKQI